MVAPPRWCFAARYNPLVSVVFIHVLIHSDYWCLWSSFDPAHNLVSSTLHVLLQQPTVPLGRTVKK
jgi:hypothetical protein